MTTVSATGTVPLTADAGGSQTVTTGQSVTFDGTGSQPSGSITSYHWAFGDGTTGSGETAQHAYSAPDPDGHGDRRHRIGQYATSQVQRDRGAAPGQRQGPTVTVTDGSNPLAGASWP